MVLWTNEEIRAKIEYEGGLAAAFEWGIKPEMAEDPRTRKRLASAYVTWVSFEEREYSLLEYLNY